MKSKDQILLEQAYQKVLKENTHIEEIKNFTNELNSIYNKNGFKFSNGKENIDRNPNFETFKKVLMFLYDGPVEIAQVSGTNPDLLDDININGINFSILNFNDSVDPNYEEFFNNYLKKLKVIMDEEDEYHATSYDAEMYDLSAMERDRAKNAWPETDPREY
jgi:hypothetical protein